MGLTVCAKGLGCEDTYDCEYITFGHFQMALAKAYNAEFGELYEKWYKSGLGIAKFTEADGKRWNEICNDDLDIFLGHSDCDGKFTPQECKKIYEAIKDLKIDMQGHNYGVMEPYNMLEQWKRIFQHCYKRKVNLYFM